MPLLPTDEDVSLPPPLTFLSVFRSVVWSESVEKFISINKFFETEMLMTILPYLLALSSHAVVDGTFLVGSEQMKLQSVGCSWLTDREDIE